MHVAHAVIGDVAAQRVQILAAALGQTFERAVQAGQNLHKFFRGRDGGIDDGFGVHIHAARLLQESKRKTRDDAKSVLAVHAAPRESHGHGLLHAVALGDIREINGSFEHGRRGSVFWFHGFDAQGKTRQGVLVVLQLDGGAHRLAGKNMFREVEAHLHAGERDGRKNSGHEDDGDQAGEHEEKKIVAGVQRGERDQKDAAEINPAGAGDAVLHFVADPAERRAAGEDRHQSYCHPGGYGKRRQCGSAGQHDVAKLGGGTGIEGQQQGDGECGDGEEESANGGAFGVGGAGPESTDGGAASTHGMRLERIAKRFSNFTAVRERIPRCRAEPIRWFPIFSAARRGRELATTRWEKTGTASCLKSSGRQ